MTGQEDVTHKLLPPPPEHKLLEPPRKKTSRRKIILITAAAFLLLLIIFLAGYIPRRNREKNASALAEQQAHRLPVVNVTQVKRSPPVSKLQLPGNITPLTEAYIYARATGYIRQRYADIGDRVRQDQLLAEIDAPDLDAQAAQGRAQLAQAQQQLAQEEAALQNSQAQEELARVTWERYRVLVEHGAVSRQEADQQYATYRSAQATVRLQDAAVNTAHENIRAAQSNLDRLIALQTFEHVRAPFSGVITARNFDVGALVSSSGASLGASSTPLGGTQAGSSVGNAGSSGATSDQSAGSANSSSPGIGNGGELYRMAQIGTVRILVNVPQINAPSIRVGTPASVFLQEYSKTAFKGRVARTANALDPITRTLPAEVDVVNRDGLLLPGMYAEVEFSDPRSSPPLLVPGDAIVTSANGLSVALLEDPTPQQKQQLEQRFQQERQKENSKEKQQTQQQEQQELRNARRIHVQKVEVGRDYGPRQVSLLEDRQRLEGNPIA